MTFLRPISIPSFRLAGVILLLATFLSAPAALVQAATYQYLAQWGGYGTGEGEFIDPYGVAVDDSGNVYVSELGNSRIQKFTSMGTYLTQWGSRGSGNGEFLGPVDLAVDDSAHVYVVDQSNHRIQKFTSMGAYLTQWGGRGTGDGEFQYPQSVAVDDSGNVYVMEHGSNLRIQKFTRLGAYLTQWGSYGIGNGQFRNPHGLGVDDSSNVYVGDTDNHRIQKFNSMGAYLAQWGTQGSGDGQLYAPYGLAVGVDGSVYVSDTYNYRMQKFTRGGTYLTQWGTRGNGPGQFNLHVGTAVDDSGHVYVADLNNRRIQKFGPPHTNIELVSSMNPSIQGEMVMLKATVFPSEATGTVEFFLRTHSLGSASLIQGMASLEVSDLPLGSDSLRAFYGGDGVHAGSASPWLVQVVNRAPFEILTIRDVPNDQGRQVRIRFRSSELDGPDSPTPIVRYDVLRRIDPLRLATATRFWMGPLPSTRNAEPMSGLLAGWDYVVSVPAAVDNEYNVVVPTLVDSTPSGIRWSVFMVRAATAAPSVYFESAPDSGYSVDNLSPPAPAPFTAAYVSGATHLHWGTSRAADFALFQLHRGTSAHFVPGSDNRITATTDTGYVDHGSGGHYYKLSAVDWNGNESPFAVLGPDGTVNVSQTALHQETWLGPVAPNPARASTTFRLTLPREMHISLAIYDAGGRWVCTLARGLRGAGEHFVPWDQRASSGRLVPSGVYFGRLEAEGETRVHRFVTVR